MSSQDDMAATRRLIEQGYNQGDLAVFDQVYAADYVDHGAETPLPGGPEGARQAFNAFHAAFPDGQFTIEDIFASGDEVATRTTFHGHHLGSYAGMEPTGRPVTLHEVAIRHFAGGKIVEEWHQEDTLQLLQELDVVPALGLTPAER